MPPRKSLSPRAARLARERRAPGPTVVLVGCGKAKQDHAASACRLYTGPLFRAAWEYGQALQGDGYLFILSAQHHVLSPWDWVEPYNLALASLTAEERRAWGVVAASCLANEVPLSRRPQIIALAGRAYVDALQHGLDERLGSGAIPIEAPMSGLGIGQRLAWLSDRLGEIHERSELPF